MATTRKAMAREAALRAERSLRGMRMLACSPTHSLLVGSKLPEQR
jgi:hypothetical protein